MSISSTLDRLHARAKQNSWLWLFSIFCRLALAAGFFPSGMVKIMDERFASGLHANHPMGHYLEALHTTGFYYTFIGVVQVAAAIMLLIPRTATLGAFLYFPIILNITILTYATRFDGSLFTAPLMTLANLYILGWNYEKWKYILPFNRLANDNDVTEQNSLESYFQTQESASVSAVFSRYGIRSLYARFRIFFKQLLNDKFPALFFAGVFAAVVICVIGIPSLYHVKPRNTLPQCLRQFKNSNKTKAGENFCNCIHINGEPLAKCMNEFFNAPEDANQTR
ncbi:MAG: DoxX family protein [Acidobacteriota bacterium]|nr:DoxX family protein [Acidobacteriota bacterium]